MKVELLEIHWHGDNARINSIDFFPNSSHLISSGVEDEEKLYIHVFSDILPLVLEHFRQNCILQERFRG